ncbi:hypothetical protein NWP96_02660 [Mycoplasmopsis cynos]|nr:hypothetical protein [Mycoplasmopsis cynos]
MLISIGKKSKGANLGVSEVLSSYHCNIPKVKYIISIENWSLNAFAVLWIFLIVFTNISPPNSVYILVFLIRFCSKLLQEYENKLLVYHPEALYNL